MRTLFFVYSIEKPITILKVYCFDKIINKELCMIFIDHGVYYYKLETVNFSN